MDGSEMRFLVVDDDQMIQDLLTIILNHLGHHEISLASTAQEALSLVESSAKPFQCILLDIQMPGMDGVELCHVLRQKRRYRDVPIVMLTAMSERHYLDQAFRNGATDYIQKPFEVTDLGVRIGVAIKLAATQAQLRESEVSKQRNKELSGDFSVPFDEAFPLNAPNAAEYHTFEKYVLAFPLRLALSTSAFAINIDGLREVHAKVSVFEFQRLVDIIGTCVASAQRKAGPLYTYSGSGVFLMLQMRGEPVYLRTLLQNFSETVVPHAENIAGQSLAEELRIQIGESVKLRCLRRHDRLILIRKAASNTLCTKGDNDLSIEFAHERSEYKRILKEFENDADDLISFVRKGQKRNEENRRLVKDR